MIAYVVVALIIVLMFVYRDKLPDFMKKREESSDSEEDA